MVDKNSLWHVQRTIKQSLGARGVGIHTGQLVTLMLKPAPVGTGVLFRRVDVDPVVEIAADFTLVSDTILSTQLSKDGCQVSTVEHLLSAVSGLGIDNLIIELDGPEVPVMDGSADIFVFILRSAGLVDQDAPKRFFRVKETVRFQENDSFIQVEPADTFQVAFSFAHQHPYMLGENSMAEVDFSKISFSQAVSRARTFGFQKDVEQMLQQGFCSGASLDNAVVFDATSVVNEGGLRMRNEPVLHKVLDIVGDVSLLGYALLGKVTGYCSGHYYNNQLLRQLYDSPSAWELVQLASDVPLPMSYR